MQQDRTRTYIWEGQRFETRTLGVVEVLRTSERSSSVICCAWGRRLPVFGGVDRGHVRFEIPVDQLQADTLCEIRRFADLGSCWLDVPAVLSMDRAALSAWMRAAA